MRLTSTLKSRNVLKPRRSQLQMKLKDSALRKSKKQLRFLLPKLNRCVYVSALRSASESYVHGSGPTCAKISARGVILHITNSRRSGRPSLRKTKSEFWRKERPLVRKLRRTRQKSHVSPLKNKVPCAARGFLLPNVISLHRRMHYPPGDFLPRHDSARLAAESEASARAFEKEQTQIEEEAARREEEAAVAAAAAAKAEDEAIERADDAQHREETGR